MNPKTTCALLSCGGGGLCGGINGDDDTEMLDSIASHNCGVGMHNFGNSCYMNTALQAIRSMKPLLHYLISEQSNKGRLEQSDRELVFTSLRELLVQMETTDASYVIPSDFHDTVLRASEGLFMRGEQEDIQEFFSFLIELLHDVTNKGVNKPKKQEEVQIDEQLTDEEVARLSRDEYRLRENSEIDTMLSGQLHFAKTCLSCKMRTSKFDESRVLTLRFPDDDESHKPVEVCSLDQCFEVLSSAEVLLGEYAINCTRCNKKTSHQRKNTLYNMPKIVVIALSRLMKDEHNPKIFHKIHTHVHFDLQNVKIPGNDKIYEAIAICDHQSQIGQSGHYVANIKNLQTGKWARMNDMECRPIDEDKVISGDNYLIILKEKSDDWTTYDELISSVSVDTDVHMADVPQLESKGKGDETEECILDESTMQDVNAYIESLCFDKATASIQDDQLHVMKEKLEKDLAATKIDMAAVTSEGFKEYGNKKLLDMTQQLKEVDNQLAAEREQIRNKKDSIQAAILKELGGNEEKREVAAKLPKKVISDDEVPPDLVDEEDNQSTSTGSGGGSVSSMDDR